MPSLGLDLSLLERLAASIDMPISRKLVMNNGPTGALDKFVDQHPEWILEEPATSNKGVAGSWNYCAHRFPNELYWLIANEDCYFLPGQLEEMFRVAHANQDAPVIHINSTHAYYCFVWTAAGRREFGTFDENIWPAYGEDFDMRYRHKLAGITSYPYALEGREPVPHGKPRVGGRDYSAMIQGCGLFNRAYMLRKWGDETFQTPYRDGRLTPKEWVWYPEERAKRWPLWQTFMEQSASIYD